MERVIRCPRRLLVLWRRHRWGVWSPVFWGQAGILERRVCWACGAEQERCQ